MPFKLKQVFKGPAKVLNAVGESGVFGKRNDDFRVLGIKVGKDLAPVVQTAAVVAAVVVGGPALAASTGLTTTGAMVVTGAAANASVTGLSGGNEKAVCNATVVGGISGATGAVVQSLPTVSAQVAVSAASGAVCAEISGGNPVVGAVTGAVSASLPNVSDNAYINNSVKGAAIGSVGAVLTHDNVIRAALTSAGSQIVSTAIVDLAGSCQHKSSDPEDKLSQLKKEIADLEKELGCEPSICESKDMSELRHKRKALRWQIKKDLLHKRRELLKSKSDQKYDNSQSESKEDQQAKLNKAWDDYLKLVEPELVRKKRQIIEWKREAGKSIDLDKFDEPGINKLYKKLRWKKECVPHLRARRLELKFERKSNDIKSVTKPEIISLKADLMLAKNENYDPSLSSYYQVSDGNASNSSVLKNIKVARRGLRVGDSSSYHFPRVGNSAHSGVIVTTQDGDQYLLEFMNNDEVPVTKLTPDNLKILKDKTTYVKASITASDGRDERWTIQAHGCEPKKIITLDEARNIMGKDPYHMSVTGILGRIGVVPKNDDCNLCHTAQERLVEEACK